MVKFKDFMPDFVLCLISAVLNRGKEHELAKKLRKTVREKKQSQKVDRILHF